MFVLKEEYCVWLWSKMPFKGARVEDKCKKQAGMITGNIPSNSLVPLCSTAANAVAPDNFKD